MLKLKNWLLKVFKRIFPIILIFMLMLINFDERAAAQSQMRERKSMHFIVNYDSAVHRSFVDKLIAEAEDSYRAIAKDLNFFRDEPWVFDKRAKIYVYKDQKEYLEKTGMPDWSYGAANINSKEVHTFDGAWKIFKYTLVHELTHLIFKEFIGDRGRIPLWLNEGAAMYMEHKAHRGRLAGRVKLVLAKEFIPMKEFMTMNFSDIEQVSNPEGSLQGDDYVSAFYLQSFSLVNFLIKKYNNFRFGVFCREIAKGTDPEKALFEAYNSLRDYEKLEAQWRRFYGF